MSSSLGEAVVDIVGDLTGLNKDIKTAKTAVGKGLSEGTNEGQRGVNGLMGGLGNLTGMLKGMVGAGLMLKLGQQALDFGKASLQSASDVNESYSKFQTVFKNQAGSVEDELSDMAENINRSKYDLMGYAATLQDTFVPLGFARDQAADLSVSLVALAEDLASFNNLKTADVVRDLQSALVGNTETIRKYGVVANQSRIQQKALEMGMWSGKGAVDAQAKAMATYMLILEGTADAQGDAMRTAESYENVSKGLEAATLDLKVAFGSELIPTATKTKKVMAELVSGMAEVIAAERAIKDARERGIITAKEEHEMINRATWTHYTFAEALDDLAQKEREQNRALFAAAEQAAVADRKFLNYAETLSDVEGETENVTDATALLEQSLSDLKLYISGPMGKEIDKFNEKQRELQGEADAVRLEIAELEGQSYLSAEQKEDLEEHKEKLGEIETATQELADEHHKATLNILFDLMMQRAAIDGVSEAEFNLMNDWAYANGMIDTDTWEMVQSIGTAFEELATGNVVHAGSIIDGLTEKINNVPRTVDVDFNIRTHGSPPSITQSGGNVIRWKADGGPVDAMMPYIVGEEGPELFVPDQSGSIIPAGDTANIMSGNSTMMPVPQAGGSNITIKIDTMIGDARWVDALADKLMPVIEAENQRRSL